MLNAYGLTETSAAAFLNPPGNVVIGSVGPPLPTVEARFSIRNRRKRAGQPVGEIIIRGPIVMKGYWNRPDATAEVLKDGWLYTGDLGYFDDGGNLFITGRRKEVIVLANGKNMYPEEIESHYLKSPLHQGNLRDGAGGKAGRSNSGAAVRGDRAEFRSAERAQDRQCEGSDPVRHRGPIAEDWRRPSELGHYEIWQEDLPRTTTRKLKRFQIEKRVRANQGKGAGGDDAEVPSERPLTPEDEEWLEREDVQRALAVIRENASKAPEKLSSVRQSRTRPGPGLDAARGIAEHARVATGRRRGRVAAGGNLHGARPGECRA